MRERLEFVWFTADREMGLAQSPVLWEPQELG